MAYVYRGRRVAYDNIAVGSIKGIERHIGQSTTDLAAVSDASLYNTDAVSQFGNPAETGGFSNISRTNLPGIEDTNEYRADGTDVSPEKLTSDGETVAD